MIIVINYIYKPSTFLLKTSRNKSLTLTSFFVNEKCGVPLNSIASIIDFEARCGVAFGHKYGEGNAGE
jgi:hypothetical protein